MKGWKTKTGVVIGLLGGAALAGAAVVPGGAVALAAWLKFGGTILSFFGSGLAGYGIAHKGEKNTAEITDALLKAKGD